MASKFIMPKQVISGADALGQSKEVIRTLGTKALVVSGKVMNRIGNVKIVTDLLDEIGIGWAVYDDITGEPDDVMIDGGVEAYKANGCDFLIAIGGGSPMDSMKAIGALITNPGKIADYMGKEITNPLPPMVAIPTTAGTGSEATQFTIITDTKTSIKMLLKGTVLIPDVAIVDASFTVSSPKSVTNATGLDALTHAVEGYTSKKASPLTDVFAMDAVKRIFKYLPRAYADGEDMEAREEMILAALEAGVVINNSSVTLVHGMSRPIGANFHVPHGLSNAMLLKVCLTFALDGTYERFADLGRAIGAATEKENDETAAKAFLTAIIELCETLEVPTLAEYGVDKEAFFEVMDKMAEDAIASGSPGNTRKTTTKEDVLRMYKELW
ncbi:MAG: iron-containing alcohol dehydrogenase [Lachnospiraceae bacterium]|nr:iron-containing alcohol dehydrogenase [Lachnospiraceae bacterium]